MKSATYNTDLSDDQWEFLASALSATSKRRRPPKHRRWVIDGILYVLKGGIPWRPFPFNIPPLHNVYHVFRAGERDHTWATINDALRVCGREQDGRTEACSAAILNRQSVNCKAHGGEFGCGAAKRIEGRKRHLLVDLLSLPLGIEAHPANIPERDACKAVLEKLAAWLGRLRKIWVDAGYSRDALEEWVRQFYPDGEAKVVKRSAQRGF